MDLEIGWLYILRSNIDFFHLIMSGIVIIEILDQLFLSVLENNSIKIWM